MDKSDTEQLGAAVGILVYVTGSLVTAIQRIAADLDDGELRQELLRGVEIQLKAIEVLREMFPVPEGGKLH